MGINGLVRYMRVDKPEITQVISILDEIEKWKSEHGMDRKPTILIDLKEFQHFFVRRSELGIILGGRYPIYNCEFAQFCERLIDANVTLIFFKGNKYIDNLLLYGCHRDRDYIQCISLLDEIDLNPNVRDLNTSTSFEFDKLKHDRRAMKTINYNLEKLCLKYGELRVNGSQHNCEIAQYALQHDDDVLAIITNDTDFMAFDGQFQFWVVRDINLSDLTTTRYCRKLLRSILGLQSHQLQLLGALSGSTFFGLGCIEDFVYRITGAVGRIPKLAKYVRQQTLLRIEHEFKFVYDFEKIIEDVIGPVYSSGIVKELKKSLSRFQLTIPDGCDANKPLLNESIANTPIICKMMLDDIFLVGDIMFIDYRNYKSKNYAELVVPVLRKLFGIVFKDDNNRPVTQKMCMKYAHDESFKVIEEQIVYPPLDLRNVNDLVQECQGLKLTETRWPLLAWVLGISNDFIELLQSTEEHKKYAVVLLTLKYLLQQEELSNDEADAILFTEYNVRNRSDTSPAWIRYPENLNLHYIRVAHLYTNIYVLVNNCLEICGLAKFTDLIQFDGPKFHICMDNFVSSPACRSDAILQIQKIRIQ